MSDDQITLAIFSGIAFIFCSSGSAMYLSTEVFYNRTDLETFQKYFAEYTLFGKIFLYIWHIPGLLWIYFFKLIGFLIHKKHWQ